jgi:hypothetical protein
MMYEGAGGYKPQEEIEATSAEVFPLCLPRCLLRGGPRHDCSDMEFKTRTQKGVKKYKSDRGKRKRELRLRYEV